MLELTAGCTSSVLQSIMPDMCGSENLGMSLIGLQRQESVLIDLVELQGILEAHSLGQCFWLGLRMVSAIKI